jgi:hypothetical protein
LAVPLLVKGPRLIDWAVCLIDRHHARSRVVK